MNIALLKIDMQIDFTLPEGALYVKGGEETIPVIEELTKTAYANKRVVVSSADAHNNPDSEFVNGGGIWPPHCVAGTKGSQIIDSLQPRLDLGEIVIGKKSFQYSAFAPTCPSSCKCQEKSILEKLLKEKDIKTVVIAGLAYDFCVGNTALDSAEKGFSTYIVEEGPKAVDIAIEGVSSKKIMEEKLANAGVKMISKEEAVNKLKA